MIVLLDRGLSSNALPAAVTGTRADFLARLSASRKPPVLRRLADGSFLSVLGGAQVRIIDCQITKRPYSVTVRLQKPANAEKGIDPVLGLRVRSAPRIGQVLGASPGARAEISGRVFA